MLQLGFENLDPVGLDIESSFSVESSLLPVVTVDINIRVNVTSCAAGFPILDRL